MIKNRFEWHSRLFLCAIRLYAVHGLVACRRISIFLLVFFLMQGFNQNVYADQAVPTDKAAHFGIAATAMTACSILGKMVSGNKWVSEGVCFLAVNSVGVAKEVTDPLRGGSRDERDIYANLAGSGFSLFAVSFGF